MQEAEIRAIQFLEPRKDAAKMLEFVDQTLHQMTFPIQPRVILTQEVGTLMRRNNRFNPSIQQIIDELLSRIAAICNQSLKLKAFQQPLSLRAIMALSGGQTQPQRIAQPIDGHM